MMKKITLSLICLFLMIGIYSEKISAQGLELKWRSPDSLQLDVYFRNIQYTTSAFDMNGDGRNEIPLVQDLGTSKVLKVWDFGLNEIAWEFRAEFDVNLYGFFDLDLDSVKEALLILSTIDGDILVAYDWNTDTIIHEWARDDPNKRVGKFIIATLDFVDAPVLIIEIFDLSFTPSIPHIEVWGSPRIDLLATGISPPIDYNPERFQLDQNYPNPFNARTTISFSLNEVSDVTVRIFNLLGQRVRTLVDQQMPIGKYDLIWDGKNEYGNSVASGQYSYQLLVDDVVINKKMILLK